MILRNTHPLLAEITALKAEVTQLKESNAAILASRAESDRKLVEVDKLNAKLHIEINDLRVARDVLENEIRAYRSNHKPDYTGCDNSNVQYFDSTGSATSDYRITAHSYSSYPGDNVRVIFTGNI